MPRLWQVPSAPTLRGCISSPAFGLRVGPKLCVPELSSFLGAGTSAPLRRCGQSFLRVLGPLDLLNPSLLPGYLASPGQSPRDTLVIWVNEQDPGSTRKSRKSLHRGWEHALWVGPGFASRLVEPYPGGLWPSVKWGVKSALPAPWAALGPGGVERVHSDLRAVSTWPEKRVPFLPIALVPSWLLTCGPLFCLAEDVEAGDG